MQQPTCTGLRVRSPSDAHVIFHAVSLNLLPIVSRRLDTEERRSISSGCVFVWEERGSSAEATGLGIERWTDSIRWGPSRVRDEFLFYHEKEMAATDREMTPDSDTASPSHSGPAHEFFRHNLVKQTYSVFVETSRGRRKWHLIAYFTPDSLDYLHTIEDIPKLASLIVPQGKYKTARSAKSRPRDQQGFDPFVSSTDSYTTSTPQPQYLSHRSGHPMAVDARSMQPQIKRVGPRSHDVSEILAPLAYLQNIPPPRRHPLDEKALMSFASGLA